MKSPALTSQSMARPPLTAFRFILVFGIVSALMDAVYEGARGVTGPFLGVLGASALLISVITGGGEAVALVFRLVFGRLADHPRLRWGLAITGYGITALAVPLLGITQALWIACLLVLAERFGKAVRSPAKDSMLAEAGSGLGRGKAFAFHEALDQIGAFIGPLLIGAALALSGSYSLGFLLLAIPGIAAMLVLFWLRRRVPDTTDYEPSEIQHHADAADEGTIGPITVVKARTPMPRQFWTYATFSSLTMLGYATFGLLSFHLVANGLLQPAMVPVVYAVAMAVDALAALASGWLYDRIGLKVLIVLPVLAAAIPWLGFSNNTALAVTGVLIWGAAMGIQESTMRAAVAELAPVGRRGSAYGIFTACYGLAWLAGSILIGVLYEQSISALAITMTVIQALAIAMFLIVGPHRTATPHQ